MAEKEMKNPITDKNGTEEVQCCDFMHVHEEIVRKDVYKRQPFHQ